MNKKYDVVVIGGGIMGLFSAYYLSKLQKKVLLIERGSICGRESSSNGLTRSFRQDYLDPFYAKLAVEARSGWRNFEETTGTEAIRKCGCLNLYSSKYGISFADSYAGRASNAMTELRLDSCTYDKFELSEKFPQFQAESAVLDTSGGVLNLPGITSALIRELTLAEVDIREGTIPLSLETKSSIKVELTDETITADAMIITAGRWTNDVLALLPGEQRITLPIKPERPIECKYFIPKRSEREKYSYKNMPIFAFLDLGIYGHPIVNDETRGVKIGYFNPEGEKFIPRVGSVMEFVQEMLPGLADADVESVTDYDQGYYQMTPEMDFILGSLPTDDRILVGAGWNGTGYKFAPLIGEALAALAFGDSPRIDISKFSIGRF